MQVINQLNIYYKSKTNTNYTPLKMTQNYTRLFLILLLSVLTTKAFTQKATISGYIEDASTGEKLIGASVYDKKTLKGTTTNLYGFFSITLDVGSVDFQVSYVGYTTYMQSIDLKTDTFLEVKLESDELIEEVTVAASTIEKIHEKNQMSAVQLQMKQVDKLPAFLGEKDIIKTIQLTPGIQSGSEGTSGLYVRGGGPDQNLILLDGVPVYNASHLFGFFSVFNSSAINNVEIMKGGFPARYGGRTSSVLDIRMKEGNTKKLSGEGSIGLISSKLTLEGPIKKDKTSFIISARRTYIDVLMQPFIVIANKMNDNGNLRAGYYFYDLNAKVNHKFSQKSKLYISTYMGKDRVYVKDKYKYDGNSNEAAYSWDETAGLDWGNITTAVRYNYMINNKLFSNFTGTYSRYKFSIGFESEDKTTLETGEVRKENSSFEYISGIYDWSGKIDFDYIPTPNHYIRFGCSETYHTFTPGVNTFESKSAEQSIDTSFGSDIIYAHEMAAYIEDDIKIGERLKVNPGIHFSSFLVNDKSYFDFQPRFTMNYLLTENMSVKASYSRMAQYLHLLTNGTIGLPTDLWVPVTDSVPRITADQYAAGLAYTLNDMFEFSIEGYYKEMDNLIEYKEGASFMGNSENWDQKIEVGKGCSYGIELFAQKKVGKTSGWIGYTLSWTNRQFDNLNFGKEFPYKYDRRHDISVALVQEFEKKEHKKWKKSLGMTWVYGTGNAISLPVTTYRTHNYGLEYGSYSSGNTVETDKDAPITSEVDNFEERNSFREPSYHRMDVSLTLSRKRNKTERSWIFSVYNAYNRQNPFYLFYDSTPHYDRQGNYISEEKQLKQLSLFPIIPSFSYTIKF